MMNKNILIISSHAILPPYKAGSKLIYEFSRYMSEKYNVFVLHANEGKYDFIPTNRITFFDFIKQGKKKFLDVSFIYKTLKLIKQEKIDIIIMHYPWFAPQLFIIKLFTKVKVIMYEHNIEYDRFRSLGKRWWKILYYYEKFACNFVDDIFFITKTDKRLAQKTLGVKNKGQVCNYGIDRKVFNADRNVEYKNELKKKHNLQEATKIILFFGSFSYSPNIEAMGYIVKHINPRLKKKHFNYKIVICGGGLDKKKYINIPDIIYEGFVLNIEKYIKGCDIMINPILSGGGVKTKVIESLACGKQVVSTIKGAEGIEYLPTKGLLTIVGNDDWDKFAEMIIARSNKKDFVPNLFLERYDWENIIDNLVL